jgi:glycosyltransferase involved in cell wall biosynthesis
MALITTVIPAFNRASVIGAAIESALAQDVPAGWSHVVLVVDDGSADDLAGAVSHHAARVKLIRHDRNLGAAAARNTGVVTAGEGLVAFLDSDDVWLPGKLVGQIEAMGANSWVASCTAYRLARPGHPEITSPRYHTGELTLADLVWGCFVSPGSTLMFERRLFDEIGPLDTTLKRLEDWDWFIRLTRKYPLGFLAEPLAYISPAAQPQSANVLAALEVMRIKHTDSLSAKDRRHFLAALEHERGAAHFRSGDFVRAAGAVTKSFLRAPFRNAALAASLHNRLARR